MTETKLTWHHPLCEGECFACLIERTIKKEYGEVGLRYLLKQINDAPVQQAEQEPVAWYSVKGGFNTCGYGTALYAAPFRTKDLTDDEIYTLYSEPCSDREMIEFARAVIAAYKEKNK